jgi:hypothetical protein
MDATLNRKETRSARRTDTHEGASMVPSYESTLLELQTQLWKARAQAKQKWLEQRLARPAKDPRAAARRSLWIKRTLETVRRGQAEIRYRAALADTYAEHLSVLEMILMGAAEQRTEGGNGQVKS